MPTTWRKMRRLAILGGDPRFGETLHVGRPNEGDRTAFLERVGDILDRNWLTNDGPVLREFEDRICASTGADHAIAVANGTLALALVVRAFDLRGEVIVPSYTFVGTAHAVRWEGLRPVFCDVEPDDHTASPASIRACVSEHTAAILPVHLWGNVCATAEIESLADELDVPVMYDAAHALACGHSGRSVGSFGVAEVFSFHATKFVHSLEGGAVVTSDADLAERLRSLRNFGFAGYDRVEALGLNAKMSEVSAAMGLSVFDRIDDIKERNRENRDAYRAGFEPIEGLTLTGTGRNTEHNLQYVVVEIDESALGVSRDLLVDALWAEGVRARRYFTPGCHRSSPYAEEWTNPVPLPVTEELCTTVMVLPTGLAVTPEIASDVCELIASIIDQADAVVAERSGLSA